MYSIDQVLLNSHAHGKLVREYLDTYRGPVHVVLTHEAELLGSAGTLHINREFVIREKEFAVLYGDVLTNCQFDRILDFHRLSDAPVTVGTHRVPNPRQCGIVVTDKTGRVVGFSEKPAFPKTDTAFSGILVGGPVLLDQIPDRVPADIAFDVLPKLVGKMFAFPIADYVADIGTVAKLKRAQKEWSGLVDKSCHPRLSVGQHLTPNKLN